VQNGESTAVYTRFSKYDLTTWVLIAGALVLVLQLGLLSSLLSGLLVYALVNALVPLLRMPALRDGGNIARLLAVVLIASIVITLIALAGVGIASFLRGSGESVPALIQRMAEIIDNSRERLPAWLFAYLPTDAEQLRVTVVQWLQSHTKTFQVAGADIGRTLAHILIGMVVGALLSLEVAIARTGHGPLAIAIAERATRLSHAFRRVVFAQIWISAFNTTLTALYLALVLPMFGVNLPFTKTLILVTFVAGLLPILGNLISNTVIFVVSLSQSLFVALASLGYLIIIHKLEYFLNARIIGGHIRARAWELLIAMLVMEAAFGIPGLIAAPIYYAYVKDELREKGLL
jgi:predicted PurR-regulated permease PerM